MIQQSDDDVAPDQCGDGPWWNDIRREEFPDEIDEVRAALVPCPKCGEQGLWATVPYWYAYCDCGRTLLYDEPSDAVEAFNEGKLREHEE